jgi:Fur family ferric uptake transcriptional regulator
MSITPDTILDVFRQKGLRITGPRRTLAALLIEMIGTDFTVEELWDIALRRDPDVGRATVFRSVEILRDLHLLDRIEFADGSHRFRLCQEMGHHHHHITCSNCGKVVEVEACLSDEQIESVKQLADFSIEGHRLEFFGRCASCRA